MEQIQVRWTLEGRRVGFQVTFASSLALAGNGVLRADFQDIHV